MVFSYPSPDVSLQFSIGAKVTVIVNFCFLQDEYFVFEFTVVFKLELTRVEFVGAQTSLIIEDDSIRLCF